MADLIWIAHTTRYRGGSTEFGIAAHTMARELAATHPDAAVVVAALDGKADFTAAMADITAAGDRITELHFLGHAGMYGPMFATTAWPEQFSPHEWRDMHIPFTPGAQAYFHTCRSARWFAPFFAETFGVPTWGHHGYTTVSARPDRFSWAALSHPGQLYLIETVGRKTHGLTGSLRKYCGSRAIPMTCAYPTPVPAARSYDAVATLYDRAYANIRVREAEWHWLSERLATVHRETGRRLRILDIGCGNGALLSSIGDLGVMESGIGVDVSAAMLDTARARVDDPCIDFTLIDSPALPLPAHSVDVVVSFLSFRYLDWDPVLAEIHRVLRPGGRLLVVDMVERRATTADLPALARAVLAHRRTPHRHPRFAHDLRVLVEHPDWQEVLRHNPIRAEHEYRWYLESRFPGARLETLTVAPHNRVVALDSGPVTNAATVPMSYP